MAVKAIGPYSRYRICNSLLITSGQLPIDPETNQIVDTFEKQVYQVMNNIEDILAEEEIRLENIIKLTIYIKSLEYFSELNNLLEAILELPYPARTVVEVSALPKDALVEIEAIAQLK